MFLPENRVAFMNAAANAIENNRPVFAKLLEQVNTPFGAEYEITQVIKTLRGVEQHEMRYLENTDTLGSVAVYGSRNIPLYTLAMHGLIPAIAAKDVWLRTPKQTSELYIALFDKLKELLPEYDLSNLHVMPPVYYDEFYKQQVLGLHHKGKRMAPDREAANAVIFVGSPETGEQIKGQILTKLGQLGAAVPAVRQAFMMFGTGLNPVVITEHAQQQQLDAAVKDGVTAVRINNAQDCIAPKLYAVHRSVQKDYIRRLTSELSKLKFGELSDPSVDYTALTFADKVEGLADFRAKHSAYLVTKDAVLDSATKRVDPHVFVFPYSKFKSGEVELQDHYAPFFVMFTYENEQQLKELACDPRVRDRAMYASLYGNAASTEMFKLRKVFEDNFHTTTLNLSVFDEESGNFPFGGYGGKASSVTLIEKDAGTQIQTTTMERPLLFSKVAGQFFGRTEAKLPPATVLPAPQHPKSKERLDAVLELAGDVSRRSEIKNLGYSQLREPQLALRPRGLAYLREQIAQKGLKVVFHHWWQADRTRERRDMQSPLGKAAVEKFYGAPVVDFDLLPEGKLHQVPGVLLHSSPVGWDTKPMNRVRGEVNPHMGYGFLTPLLWDRVNEYHAVDAIWPGLMPPAEPAKDLRAAGTLDQAWDQQRDLARDKINTLLRSGKTPSTQDLAPIREALKKLVDGFMQAVQTRFPKGAFIKNYGECTTGDLGIQITSFHYNVDNIVDQYMAQFGDPSGARGHYAQQAARKGTQPIDSKEFSDKMLMQVYATGTKFVQKLLTSPDELLAQERMKIGKTALGFNQEIRVDFMDGEPVSARSRYSHEYLREEEAEAKAVLRELFEKAPEKMKYMCGGADLVKLEDGSWKLVELNPGPYSGSISARTFPIETNRFISELSGQQTPMIQELEALVTQPAETQKAYLKKLKVQEEKWNKLSAADISVAEVGKYLRDRLLDGWMTEPTRERGDALLVHLRTAFADVNPATVRDLALLVRGAEDFIQAKLTQRSAPSST